MLVSLDICPWDGVSVDALMSWQLRFGSYDWGTSMWGATPVDRYGVVIELPEGVPENPDKPGEYQWEALTDVQAESLIRPVTDLVDRHAWETVQEEEEDAAQVVRDLVRQHLL